MCRVDDKGERCSKVVSRRQNDVSFFSKFFSSTFDEKKNLEKSREKFKKKVPVNFFIYISILKLNSDSLIKFDLINGKPSETINIGNIFEETI